MKTSYVSKQGVEMTGVVVHLDKEVVRQLDALADQNYVTRAQLLRRILAEHVRRNQPRGGAEK